MTLFLLVFLLNTDPTVFQILHQFKTEDACVLAAQTMGKSHPVDMDKFQCMEVVNQSLKDPPPVPKKPAAPLPPPPFNHSNFKPRWIEV